MVRNFTKEELECPCCGECRMDVELLTKLQAYRDHLGIPLVVTSGYRCSEHNERVGGALNSMHTAGKAVDIRIYDKDSHTRFKLIKYAFLFGFRGIGIGKNHFHIDTRASDEKSWSY